MADDKLDRVLSSFSAKGPAIQKLEKRMGTIENPVDSDLMEREFRPYTLKGNRDPNSGAELVGNETEFVEKAREARDDRLVGMASGQVARAAGSLSDGTAMIYDGNGRPLVRSGQQVPVQQTRRRSTKEW
jgi:hypothetical protein